MGREIRKVPKGWQHPVDKRGHYKSMYDTDYPTAVAEWLAGLDAWRRGDEILPDGTPAAQAKDGCEFYWEYYGGPPDRDTCRPAFEGEADCYQIYETVTEGTPVSPVFESLNDLESWLVHTQGHTAAAAERFAKLGHAFSFMISVDRDGNHEVTSGIDALGKLGD